MRRPDPSDRDGASFCRRQVPPGGHPARRAGKGRPLFQKGPAALPKKDGGQLPPEGEPLGLLRDVRLLSPAMRCRQRLFFKHADPFIRRRIRRFLYGTRKRPPACRRGRRAALTVGV